MAQASLHITPSGERRALQLIRAHRLWERYLADKEGLPLTALHDEAMRREHLATPEQVDALARELGNPQFDPHGDPIPTARGELTGPQGSPLPQAPLNRPLRVVHLEDEPPAVYAQLVAIGLAPGVIVRALPLWRALTPVVVAAALMTVPRLWPLAVPDPGLPLVFLVSALVAIVCSPRFPVLGTLNTAMDEAMPVLGILTGVGAFIQVMTLTGGRGWLVAQMLGAPSWALVAAAAVSLPLFGAISAFGSASVLGVPFLLAFLGRNEVVTTAALSLLASLGDLMLPAAIAATLAARVAGVADRRRVLRLCVLPALLAAGVAVAALLFAPALGRLLM